MLLANEINRNNPNTTFVAATVPKLTWALHFFHSSILSFSQRRGDLWRPFSCGSSRVDIFKESLSVVSSESKMSVWTPARPILVNCLGVFKNELDVAWFK